MRVVKFDVALIHNRDPERLRHVRPAAQHLAWLWNTGLTEVYEQPDPVQPHAVAQTLWRSHCHIRADRLWQRYRGGARVSCDRLLRDDLDPVGHAAPLLDEARRASAISAILTGKHVEAWTMALARNTDFLLVLEDDATFKADSMARFVSLSGRLAAIDPACCLYIDVAGGLRLCDLGLDAIDRRRDRDLISFARPVTNTTCGYVVSRGAIDVFVEAMRQITWARQGLSADWFVNMLLVEGVKTKPFICWHACPTILDHGTKTGLYASSLERPFA